MSLGATLKNLRLRKGESLQQLADAVGASKAHVWELETGKSKNPSLDLLSKLAEHFEISLSLLIGEIPEDETSDDPLVVMYRDMKEITESDRDLLKTIIQGMKNRARGKGEKDSDA